MWMIGQTKPRIIGKPAAVKAYVIGLDDIPESLKVYITDGVDHMAGILGADTEVTVTGSGSAGDDAMTMICAGVDIRQSKPEDAVDGNKV